MTLLRVEELGYTIGNVPVLDHVSFEVRSGELVALMGRNGAGKSTLIDCLAGLREPSSGRILLEERALDDWSSTERARRIAHLPQTVTSDLPFTALELVMMGRYPRAGRWFESEADHVVTEHAMRRAGCLDLGTRRVSTLSGGERQRVLLAACLAQQAQLLLLDEPLTFLDVDQELRVFSLLREEVERGAACIAVTHDINMALNFGSRLVVLAERTVAVDLASADALLNTEWLGLFSPRLALTTTASGRPWVAYR